MPVVVRTAASLCLVTAMAGGGCARVLDQDRTPPATAARPAAGPTVATEDRGQPQPLPGLAPPPKPFIDTARFKSTPAQGKPSTLLQVHASPAAPVPLSEFGAQPVHAVDDFPLGPGLTAAAVRRAFGPPAGLAGVEDPWVVYRVTDDREMWLHFAGDDGPLTAADLVRGAETGYIRDRLYPTR